MLTYFPHGFCATCFVINDEGTIFIVRFPLFSEYLPVFCFPTLCMTVFVMISNSYEIFSRKKVFLKKKHDILAPDIPCSTAIFDMNMFNSILFFQNISKNMFLL